MTVIIEFCAHCGVIVPEPSDCPNCGENIENAADRCSGTFSLEDAKRLYDMNGYELGVKE